jgi:exopolysaccharide biosynthesis polyprenyl glycosylphosphotransferase
MKDKIRIFRYLFFDFLSALLAWQLFNIFRFSICRQTINFPNLTDFLISYKSFWLSLIIPLFWLVLYYFNGYYARPRRKTNLGDLLNTALCTLLGVLAIFFLVVINDYPETPDLYYEIAFGFFGIHFFCTWFSRYLQTAPLLLKQSKGLYCVPIFIIGTGENAQRVFGEFNRYRSNFGHRLVGFIRTGSEKDGVASEEILGEIDQLGVLIKKYGVEELVFAIDSRDPDLTQHLLDVTYQYHLRVRAVATKQDIISGKVSLFSLFGIPMVNLSPSPMPVWQNNIKNVFDRISGLILLLFLFPLFLLLAIRVRLDSTGSIFYAQERVGKNGKIFKIYKFRTMFTNAESEGPLLSCVDDARITRYGRFMRKYRLDELPQFWNVLKGDMSLVGPRPERQYFVDQIVKKAPHYYLTQSVLPGVTSWGMVKFGYANTVEKMIRRLEYDIIYLENQSLLIDFKILVFTLKPLVSGKGV